MTDHAIQLPYPILRGSPSTRCIEDIMRPREPQYEKLFKPGQEQLGHYYLAPFQRPAVWTEQQAARLIESIHLGISIGGIVVSDCGNVTRAVVDGQTVETFPDTADLIIDGQQRMRSLARYLANELTVFAGTPAEHRFDDLERVQKRRFMGTGIGITILEAMDMASLAELYDRLNFGGTPHTEDQRALPKVAS